MWRTDWQAEPIFSQLSLLGREKVSRRTNVQKTRKMDLKMTKAAKGIPQIMTKALIRHTKILQCKRIKRESEGGQADEN